MYLIYNNNNLYNIYIYIYLKVKDWHLFLLHQRSISVHFVSFQSTSVYFSPCDRLRSSLVHLSPFWCPLWSTLVHLSSFGQFGSFWHTYLKMRKEGLRVPILYSNLLKNIDLKLVSNSIKFYNLISNLFHIYLMNPNSF